VLIGTLAEQVPNEWLTWNCETQKTGHPGVNATLVRAYREGWKIEGLG